MIKTTCIRCGFDNSFIEHEDLRYCIRCGEKLIKVNPKENGSDITLLSPEQVCQILQITKPTLYQYVHRNQIPFIKFGKNLRFEEKSIKQYIDGGKRE